MAGVDYEDGYVAYVPNTIDLGNSLLVGVLFALIIGYLVILPAFVVLTRRQDASRRFREENPPTTQEQLQQDATNNPLDEDAESVAYSTSSRSSSISHAVAAILDHPQVPKSKAARKRRRRKERQLQQIESGTVDVSVQRLMQGIYPGGIPQLQSHNNNNDDSQRQLAKKESGDETEPFVETVGGSSTKTIPSGTPTPPLPTTTTPTTPTKYAHDFNSLGTVDKCATIAAWDVEMKRIIRLSIPYCTQALITGFTDTMNVAIIGKLIGTKEVSAYVIVNLLVELSSEFVGGLHEALATLCSQAIGANNKKLAGQYCQIVVILYTLFFIPFMILWAAYMGNVLQWFGFDDETVEIGKQYNYILIVDLLIDGLGEAVHGLLDVGGFEKFSTLIGATEEAVATITLLFVALFGSPTLVTVGLIQLFLGVLFLIVNILVIWRRGWFKAYYEGMFGTFALFNGKTVWLVSKTALALSLGMLLTDGEWEIYTIFASFLGPAEVAAWGILDTVWSATHELVDGMADASEVRCAFLLGSGDPLRAKVSAYKSMYFGTFAAVFLTSFIYMAGDDLPTWLTSDPALQKLLRDLLPLFGIGNFVMALDTMSWTLLGSQGRYRLATVIVCLGSWLVSIPLAAVFSIAFRVNLQGQMTAFITGYLVMGIIHTYFLLCSDWEKLSKTVMEDNEAVRQMVEEDNSSSPITKNSSSPQSISLADSSEEVSSTAIIRDQC